MFIGLISCAGLHEPVCIRFKHRKSLDFLIVIHGQGKKTKKTNEACMGMCVLNNNNCVLHLLRHTNTPEACFVPVFDMTMP